MLKPKLDVVPITQSRHLIIRVCKKRGINNQEIRAMIEMCERVKKDLGDVDVRINTIAAIAFWKVLEYSIKYRNKWSLTDFCKNHEKIEEEKGGSAEMQKHFDVTEQNVRKVFKDSIKPHFLKYLPNWEGRVPIESQLKQDDYEE